MSLNPVLPRACPHEIHGVPLPGGELSIAHDAIAHDVDGIKILRTPRGLRVALTPT